MDAPELCLRTDQSPAPLGSPDRLRELRVALVHDWLTGLRGGEKCLESLCRIFPRATIYTLIHRAGSVGPVIERLPIRTSPLQWLPGIHRYYRATLPLMPWAAAAWRPGAVDLVVSLSHCVAKAVVTPPGVPHVCYCFTPMRYAWDGREAYLAHWSNHPIRLAIAGWILDRLREWDRETSTRVTHFIGISQTVRERIAAAYGRESCVIEPPVDTDFYTPRPSVPREPHYLCLSALVSYKRIDHAIAACRALDRELLIIGDGPDRQRLESISGPGTRFLGWQPDEQIRDQLRRCRALLFPGEEDFGIVPLEAMATGTPVIALGRGGARETVADVGGALYETPTVAGLKQAIERWESRQSPNFDPIAARERATFFSADRFRARMHAFLAKVVQTSENSPISMPHFRAIRKSNSGVRIPSDDEN